jgi:large subunit ribosomal protein L6
MSRVASRPIDLPTGVTVTVAGDSVTVKGAKGSLSLPVPKGISVVQENKQVAVKHPSDVQGRMSAGSTRAHLANMVTGVSKGYETKLELVGVGYRAAVQGKALNLTLGFSHPVAFPIPEGISIETPTQTEILIKGVDTQRVGQIAAEIRSIRPPEPYKGKGVKYAGEKIALKEGKKK